MRDPIWRGNESPKFKFIGSIPVLRAVWSCRSMDLGQESSKLFISVRIASGSPNGLLVQWIKNF